MNDVPVLFPQQFTLQEITELFSETNKLPADYSPGDWVGGAGQVMAKDLDVCEGVESEELRYLL